MTTNRARIITGVRAALVVGLLATAGMSHAAVIDMPQQPAPNVQKTVGSGNIANPTAKPAPASQATNDSYAQREASSRDVGDFSGGHAGIYIGGSTVAVVLLIVLLVVLL